LGNAAGLLACGEFFRKKKGNRKKRKDSTGAEIRTIRWEEKNKLGRKADHGGRSIKLRFRQRKRTILNITAQEKIGEKKYNTLV